MELERRFAHGPRIIIRNLHQYPLTAFVVRTEPKSVDGVINTLVYDALTRVRLLAPIPRGMSSILAAPHQVGGPLQMPTSRLQFGKMAAPTGRIICFSEYPAVGGSWQTAMTGRSPSFKLAWRRIGLLRNTWQPRRRRSQLRSWPGYGSPIICSGPPRRIDPPPVWLFWRGLYSRASQQRDSLRQALGGSIASAH